MKTAYVFGMLAVLLLALSFISSGEVKEDKHKYVGAKRCKLCHSSKAKGDQYSHWKDSKHSQAYITLGTEKAKELAKKVGLTEDPQKSEKCLRCHVAAYGVDQELLATTYKQEEGVSCEACHGPGGDYWKPVIMKDRQKALDAGLIIPDEKLCIKCHNKESPSFTGFDFKTYFPKIAHPRKK